MKRLIILLLLLLTKHKTKDKKNNIKRANIKIKN